MDDGWNQPAKCYKSLTHPFLESSQEYVKVYQDFPVFCLGGFAFKKNDVGKKKLSLGGWAGDSHYAKGQSANIHSKSKLVPLCSTQF